MSEPADRIIADDGAIAARSDLVRRQGDDDDLGRPLA
jgi:hypothetical protein